MLRALLLIADGFDDDGYLGLVGGLQDRAFAVSRVGAKAGATYTGQRGTAVTAELGYLNANVGAYALAVVPDGAAGGAVAGHKSLVNLVYSLGHMGRAVGAVGTGVRALLAAAAQKSPYDIPTGVHNLRGDLVKGRLLAAPVELREEIEKAGARWSPDAVVVDGPVVTASSLAGASLGRFVGGLVPTAERYARSVPVP